MLNAEFTEGQGTMIVATHRTIKERQVLVKENVGNILKESYSTGVTESN